MVRYDCTHLVEDADTVESVLRLHIRAVLRVEGRFRNLELLEVGARASRLHEISPTKYAGL